MKNLRIVFMGTPDFAVTILDNLVNNNYNVVGVITAPDKPAGRGRKMNESSVKKYAKEKSLVILQPTNLKSDEFNKTLQSLKPDIQIVVAFRMLPKIVWQLPKFGTFNLHASLLPEYRGAAPIHWSIINGETKTGVTTFFIDDKIDTGEIILQDSTDIVEHETVGSLHDKLMFLGADLVIKTVDLIQSGNIRTTKQPELEEKSAPKLNADNTRIDWSLPINNVYNKIRGLNPFPSAWSILSNNKEEIKAQFYDVEKIYEEHNLDTGKIITTKKELKVAVANGFIKVNEIKLSGKRKMDVKSFLNGFTFSEDTKML